MRIVFILNSSGLYGANRSLLGMLQHIHKNNSEIQCFALIPVHGEIEKELDKLNIEYKVIHYRACMRYPWYTGFPFLSNLIRLPNIINSIKGWNVDIIHTNNSDTDIGLIAARILHKKHVQHVREVMEISYSAKYIFPKFYKKLREKSDAVICVSHYTFDYNAVHFPNNNMKMIYNPYNIEYYNVSRESFAPNETITILMAGSFVACKRQLDSVKAINTLIKRGIKNLRLIIAGSGVQTYIDEIEEYINVNNLEQWVTLIGFIEDLREIRRESDIALCCSEGEALPRVVVEGMLGELLSIGANSGGVAELIRHEERGLLYELGDYIQLANQIEYAINHKEECRKMILAAKQYAIENFELTNSAESVVEVYKELLDNK